MIGNAGRGGDGVANINNGTAGDGGSAGLFGDGGNAGRGGPGGNQRMAGLGGVGTGSTPGSRNGKAGSGAV